MSLLATKWFVYIIQSSDDSLYAGITTDVLRRWDEHCSSDKGAKYFRGRKPKAIVFISEQEDRSSATRLEIQIKKLTRIGKLKLIDSNENQIEKLGLSNRSGLIGNK